MLQLMQRRPTLHDCPAMTQMRRHSSSQSTPSFIDAFDRLQKAVHVPPSTLSKMHIDFDSLSPAFIGFVVALVLSPRQFASK